MALHAFVIFEVESTKKCRAAQVGTMAADIMAMEGNLVFSSKIDGFESSLTSRIM